MSGHPPPRVLRLERCDSTNAEARRRAETGERGPLWIVADRQTAGRGRSGREWASPEGNLHATWLGLWHGSPQHAALASFAACLAVADLADALTGKPTLVTLKWPNDVLVRGRKVAGVLLEGGNGWLMVGIGVNLAHAPDDARWPADVLPGATPAEALDVLAPALDRWLGTLGLEGFAPLREAWLARAARRGETMEARLPRETVKGRFVDLAADGSLMLETTRGTRRIAAGDVHFPEEAAPCS